MKNDPRSNYEHWEMFGIKNKAESDFMRKGEVGDHKNHMHAELEKDIDEWVNECQKKMDSPISFTYTPT